MEFDRFTVALLVLRPDAPHLDDEAATALQDAHLVHLADLHAEGHLLAAGPLVGDGPHAFRGLVVYSVDAERARELSERDPAVRAGRFSVVVQPWMVPAGAVSFAPARFPRSVAEATGA
jgi:uncharacterized protein